jgi:nitrite reductase (NO-forming)
VPRPRSVTAVYQTAARVWLTLAGLALLLPLERRLGLWLPLHLALAGAVTTAISGAMQNFMLALTATPAPPAWATWTQFGLLSAGVVAIAIGMPTSTPWLTGVGGVSLVTAMGFLAWMLWRAWRRAIVRRHALPIGFYAAALAFVLVGASLGATIGARLVTGETYLHLRRGHMTMNVLGFASLTVVGTLITLLPTVLRVRMAPWRGRIVLALFVAGLLVQLLGWDLGSRPLLAVGGALYAAGAVGVVTLLVATLRVERAFRPPVAAWHMVAGIGWFVAGAVLLAVALSRGPAGFDSFRSTFLVAFVGGWLIQVLLGAWSYLLPMATPGHPDRRRRSLASVEMGARAQVVVLNVGLVLLALRGAGLVGPAAGDVAVVLTAVGGVVALAKAWLFPWLGDGPVETARARAVWGSPPER